jgi:hypothetical protein
MIKNGPGAAALRGASLIGALLPLQEGQALQQQKAKIGMLGGTFPLLQSHQVAGPLQALPLQRRARILCEWSDHPTGLLLAAGKGFFCNTSTCCSEMLTGLSWTVSK